MAGVLAELHGRLAQAESAGLVPHLGAARRPDHVATWMAHGARWRRGGAASTDRLVLLGEPGAVAALRVLHAGGPDAPVAVVDRPDPDQLAAALAGAKRPRLLVLPGPPWVMPVAHALRDRVKAVTFLAGDALALADLPPDLSAWPRAESIDEPGCSDPRFAAVLAGALCLAGFARLEPQPLQAALTDMAAACDRRGIHDNPGFRLGAVAARFAAVHALTLPALLVPRAALDPWASWASRCWAAFSCRAVPVAGGVTPRGGAGLVVRSGDEGMVQRLVEGPRDLWALLLEVEGDRPLDRVGRAVLQAHHQQLVGDGRPVVRLGLRDTSAATRLALSLLWMHAALVAAALEPVDPLTMDAADAWRERVAQALDALPDLPRGAAGAAAG